ncbi:MAG: HDOD domain-containing protein [Gemmataceae bacterium]|nr:HDOD domain-containing protein [Gemmataceae bacterium]
MLFRAFARWLGRPTEILPPAADKISRVAEKITQLPTMSETAIRAMMMANDESYSLKDFIELVRRDGSITAVLLKVANSALYRGRNVVETIDGAIVRLGTRKCADLIISTGVYGITKHADKSVRERCDILWRHSFFTACMASKLNLTLRLGFKGEEFTAALLHDLGRLVLAVADPATARRHDPMTFDEPPDIFEKEQEAFGTDHGNLGELFGKRQNLPEPVLESIRFHHCPKWAPNHTRLVHLIALADHLANHVLRERKISNYQPCQCYSFEELLGGRPPKAIQAAIDALPFIVKAATRETRATLKAQVS